MLSYTKRKKGLIMKKILSTILIFTTLFTSLNAKSINALFQMLNTNEKIFVVERENSSLAVIEKGMTRNHISGMHNMKHGVVKFYENDGYVISRDGYVIKFDPRTEKIIKEVKTSDSAIGFTINKNFLAVANYAKKSVVFLTVI